MNEQLAIEAAPSIPEPTPTAPEVVVEAHFVDPNVTQHAPEGSFIDVAESDVVEVAAQNPDSQPYSQEPKPASSYASQPEAASRHDDSYPDRHFHSAPGQQKAASPQVQTTQAKNEAPRSESQPVSPEIKTAEQLRAAYHDRMTSIVGEHVDLKSKGYDEASLTELEDLCIRVSKQMINGKPVIPSLARLRQMRTADTILNKQEVDTSFDTLAAREKARQKSDALRKELFKEATDYYGKERLSQAGYRWASAHELNAAVLKAKGSSVTPFLPNLKVQRSHQKLFEATGIKPTILSVDQVRALYRERIGQHRPRARAVRYAGNLAAAHS